MLTYTETIGYVESIPGFTKKNSLENTRRLLQILGDPQDACEVIHVAGTNGKGSVCAYMYQSLRRGNVSAGLFTSPHLVTIRERFIADDEMITEDEFVLLFQKVRGAVDILMQEGGRHPAYFEFLLAMGFCFFEMKKVSVLVMETGMGGLKDATNVVERPALAVITSISLDHTEYLGDTIEAIAQQKAGIIKEGIPVVFDASCESAAAVIRKEAQKKGAPAYPVYPGMREIIKRENGCITFVLNNRFYDNKVVTTATEADYQTENAALAMTALRVWDHDMVLRDTDIIQAVAATRWKGRMEEVAPGVIVDGAHNADGIVRFLETVKRAADSHRVALLFSAVVEKNYKEMIREICEAAEYAYIVVTQIEGHRKVAAQHFADIFAAYTDAPVYAREQIDEALQLAMDLRSEDIVLYCAGSLYLIGEVEHALGGQKHDQL